MIKAVLCDMDGTLADTERVAQSTFTKLLGHELTENDRKVMTGITWAESADYVANKYKLDPEQTLEKALSLYGELLKTEAKLLPCARRLLQNIKSRNLKIGLVSGSFRRQVDTVLKLCNIRDFFDVTVAFEDYSAPKPNPAAYLKAAEILGMQPNQCLVIEDSTPGIEAAKVAGMFCIAVRAGESAQVDVSAADFVIDTLEDFDYSLLEQL